MEKAEEDRLDYFVELVMKQVNEDECQAEEGNSGRNEEMQG